MRGRWIALAVLAFLLLLQITESVPFQERLRAFLFDSYQSISPRPRLSSPAVIVDIDEASLRRFGQWPWPRSLLALLVGQIAETNPAAVGFDILMPEPDRTSPCNAARYVPDIAPDLVGQVCSLPSNDALLARAIKEGRVALSVAAMHDSGDARLSAAPMFAVGGDPRPALQRFEGALASIEEHQVAAAGHAVVSADTERGIVRRLPLAASVGTTVMPSLALELLRLATRSTSFTVTSADGKITGVGVGDLFIPTQEDGRIWVHYGRYDSNRYVSAAAVLDGAIDRELLENRLVLIGVTGLGLVDYPVTSLGERVPGVELHAQVLESIFDGTTLLRPPWALWVEAAVVAALGLALIFGFVRMSSMVSVTVVFACVALLLLAGLWGYAERRILLDAATPALLVIVLFGGLLAYELMREQVQLKALEASLQVQREAAAKIAGEMAAARRIQLGMVPDAKETFGSETRIDIAARMEPARDVGGDLYDCFMLDEHRAFFLLGDVCGKGVPASLFMATSKTLCKSVAMRGNMDLGQVMNQANLEIVRDNSEMLFVTAFAGIVDLRSGDLWYANAGHERPFVAASGRMPTSLDGEGGPPFGILDSADYPVQRYRLKPDEFLCVVSDGVTEATNSAEKLFGKERLAKALSEIRTTDRAEDVLESLFRRVDEFAAGAERSDDVTVLVLRCPGAA
jgi:serine phosphatase RsbU (regulator of sigma subunit)